MRPIIDLLLLISVGIALTLPGCREPQRSPIVIERIIEEARDPEPVQVEAVADTIDTAISTPTESGAPDPLAAEPVLAESDSLMAAAGSRKDVWLFCYGFAGCKPCLYDRPKIDGWANQNGLTVSEANVANSRLARVQHVDILRDQVKRDLRYGNVEPLYPTYLIVDQQGRTLWHHVGSLDAYTLDQEWRRVSGTVAAIDSGGGRRSGRRR